MPSYTSAATNSRELAQDYEYRAQWHRKRARKYAQMDNPKPNVPIKPVNGFLQPMEFSTAGYDR